MKRVSARWLCVAVLAAGAALAWIGLASAQVEYCPASIGEASPVGAACHCGPGALWGYTLNAIGARTVAGAIEAQTSAGWFIFPFAEAELAEHTIEYHARYVTFSDQEYYSAPLYVRFPQAVTITRWWVDHASVSGDAGSRWDEQGAVHCQPRAGLGSPTTKPTSRHDAHVLTPMPDVAATPPAGQAIATAAVVSPPPGWTACAKPFTNARAVFREQLQFPAGPRFATEVVVRVAIAATGTLDDAWVVVPSGFPAYDREALRVVRAGRYAGGTALCEPAPGTYLYVLQFR